MLSHNRVKKVPRTILRSGVYHFNMRTPVGNLRLSLMTRDARVAMGLAGPLALHVDKQIRTGMKLDQLRQIAGVWLMEELDKAFISRTLDFQTGSPQEVEQERDHLIDIASDWADQLDSGLYSGVWPLVTAIEQRYSLDLAKSDRRILAGLLCLANRELYERRAERNWPSPLSASFGLVEPGQPDFSGKPLSALYEEYAEQKTRSGQWSVKKTITEYKAAIGVAIELIGDIPVNEFDKAAARKYSQDLLRYPLNRNKGKLKDMPIQDLLADDSLKRPRSQRINNLFTKFASFVGWLVEQEYCAKNPLAGLNPSGHRKGDSDRVAFEPEDIRLLFGTPIHTDGEFKHSYSYWLPLFGLYTGARLNELCQLDVTDIVQGENPKYVIRIRADDGKAEGETVGKKRVKTKASIRAVPVHAHLLELGFADYLASRPLDGKLFEVKYYEETETWSHDAQRWFSRLKSRLGVNEGKVFHSFRNTMVDALIDSGTEDPKIRAIVGHGQSAVTYAVYGSGFKPHQLNPEVQKLNWREELAAVKPWGHWK